MDERQIEFKYYEEDISLPPWKAAKRDKQLGRFFRTQIKSQLTVNAPITRKYASELAINSLADQIATANMVGSSKYPFTIWVSSFEAIQRAWDIQKERLHIIGELSPNNYFAAIDPSASTIAVHVPKSKRQVVIEEIIDNAIQEFHTEFLEKKNMKPISNFDDVVKTYLALENHEKYVKPIKIVLLWNKMSGEYDTRTLANGRDIYLQFKRSRNTLYFHIPKKKMY